MIFRKIGADRLSKKWVSGRKRRKPTCHAGGDDGTEREKQKYLLTFAQFLVYNESSAEDTVFSGRLLRPRGISSLLNEDFEDNEIPKRQRPATAVRKEGDACFVRTSPRNGTAKRNMASAREWQPPTAARCLLAEGRKEESVSPTKKGHHRVAFFNMQRCVRRQKHGPAPEGDRMSI